MRVKRIDLIERYILEERSVSLDALCEKFNVSKNTIRRDIETLVEKGTMKKVYGGVTLKESSSGNHGIPYEERHMVYPEEKDAIAKLAAEYVNEGDTIYIDAGTTCLNMVDYIREKKCTVITNSLQIYWKSIPYTNLNVISIPGKLKRQTLSFVGYEAIPYLKNLNIGKAFLGCTGVSIDSGLTNTTMEEYVVKNAVVENSRMLYLLADHSKFGKFSLMTYCQLKHIHHIITDTMPTEDYRDYCQIHEIELHTIE